MDVVSSFGHWRRSRVPLGINPGSGAGERVAQEAFPAATILCPGVMFADDGGDERRHDDRRLARYALDCRASCLRAMSANARHLPPVMLLRWCASQSRLSALS